MELKIRPLRRKDFGAATKFAVEGMRFDKYTDNPLFLKLYGKYFWYSELSRATQVIAAYYGDRLAGVLLADMKGECRCYHSSFAAAYVKTIDFLQDVLFKSGVDAYERANAALYSEFTKKYSADGEICFLAADPGGRIKGVGSLLLKELERREAGRRIYLYTDSNCTYQFYEHRGFVRVGEKRIRLALSGKNKVPLSCWIYSKVCGEQG